MKLDRETRRRLIVFALLEAAVLLVLFGALFAGYTVYTRDSRERAALDLAEDYATSLSSLSYDALAEGDAPIGNGCFYAVYALRGDGEYEMDTPYVLIERLKPGIGGQTDAIDRQTFAIDGGGEYTFLTYTTELEAPDRTCYLKIFIPSALADEMLTGAGNAAVPFVVAFVVIALASAFALGYIQVRPLLISYGKQKAFVNDMSHEIRTPLAIIRGNLDNVLAGDGVDDASRESLRECVSEVEYMTDISAGLLNIVRAGNRNVGKDGNVSETVSSVVDMYADLANSRSTATRSSSLSAFFWTTRSNTPGPATASMSSSKTPREAVARSSLRIPASASPRATKRRFLTDSTVRPTSARYRARGWGLQSQRLL